MLKLRKPLSQNFLHDRSLVNRLVGLSSIGKLDLVLEIGPGDGIILESLLDRARQVIGIEIDFDLYQRLQQRYKNRANLSLYLGDVLALPAPRGPYKVFSNIPFSIEGQLIRKFLDDPNPPEDCFLVVRRDLAERLLRQNTLFGATYGPFFEFSIFHRFRRRDFRPVPKVEAMMFRFKKREKVLLSWEEKKRYQKFVRLGYGSGQPVYRNLKGRVKVPKYIKPNELSLENWIRIYKGLPAK
ncbi:MAG TPA: rRNA adenine N-6-methyltransferase family protein [Patescibacteria group bacterium]|nr:rRNA adenine N-6-methyltransferase family protein [Patescibacteria group bacterium]